MSDKVYPKDEAEFLVHLRALMASYEGGSGFAAEAGAILGGQGMTDAGASRYNAGAYLMRDVCVLAFNYAASVVGASGFQASVAALEAYGLIVGIEQLGVVDLGNVLYPQYDLHQKLDDWIAKALPDLREKARKLLAENDRAHPDVRARWQLIATGRYP